MTAPAEILIVGGGIAGLATAYFLSQEEGVSVRLLEKEDSVGQHSTGRNAAILRSWTPDPVLSRFAVESSRFLMSPPAGFADVPLLDPCGLILVSTKTAAETRAVYSGWCDSPPQIEELSEAQFRKLAPHFGPLPSGAHLLHFPGEGRLDVAAMVQGFANGAAKNGAQIDTGVRVSELVQRDGEVQGVVLEDGSIVEADLVVLAAGGWATRLAEGTASRMRLSTTRRHLLVTDHDARVDPNWPIVWCDSAGFYTRPESGGLLISACDQTVVDPDHFVSDPAVLESIATKTAELLPEFANARAAHFWAGMRTLSDDGRFVIGPDDDVPGLFWVAGLGGHGMTSSAAIGQAAAAAVVRCQAPPHRQMT